MYGNRQFLAAGDMNGNTHVIELPKTLTQPTPNEVGRLGLETRAHVKETNTCLRTSHTCTWVAFVLFFLHCLDVQHQFVKSFIDREVQRLTGESNTLPEVELLSMLKGADDGKSQEEQGGDVTLHVPTMGEGGAAIDPADSMQELNAIYLEFQKAEKDFLVQVGLCSENDGEEGEQNGSL